MHDVIQVSLTKFATHDKICIWCIEYTLTKLVESMRKASLWWHNLILIKTGNFEFKTSLFPPYDQNIECQKNPHPVHTQTCIKCNCFYFLNFYLKDPVIRI